MTTLICLFVAFLSGAPGAQDNRRVTPLAPGNRIALVASKDAEFLIERFEKHLTSWGRWTVVRDPKDADLVGTISGKGHSSKATLTFTISRTVGGPTLVQFEDTSRRNPYRSNGDAFTRTIEAILDQMREASNKWPVE